MKVAVQHTLLAPGDWDIIDSADWGKVPFRAEPVGGEILDQSPGWIFSVCIQGMTFIGDHYAVLHDEPVGGCTVLAWFDDPDDWQPNEFYAHVVAFRPYEADPEFGGAYHGAKLQQRKIFGGSKALTTFANWTVEKQAWNKFPRPASNIIRHGIWVTDEQSKACVDAREKIGWKDWTEGVPVSELTPEGRVKTPGQR